MPFPAIGAAALIGAKALAAGGAAAGGAAAGGAAGGLITGEVIAAGVATVGGIGARWVAGQAAATAGRYALGAAIAPWVGGVLLAGTILYGGYKILNSQSDKGNEVNVEINLKEMAAKFKNQKVTNDEFAKAANDAKLTSGLQKAVKDYQKENNWTAKQVYDKILQEFRSMDNFNGVSDDAKRRYASKISGYTT